MKTQKNVSSKTYVAITIDAKASRRLRQAVKSIAESADALVFGDVAPPQHR
jgi:hypothetical protein